MMQMSYLSFSFMALVAALVVCFYLIPRKWNCRYLVLLLGSLYFYWCFDPRYLLFLLFAAVSTFVCALLLGRIKRRKLLLALCVAANLAVWFTIKVLPWALTESKPLFYSLGMTTAPALTNLLVPVGISYYTLQAIAYVADVYTGKAAPEKNFLKYLLFISYFPAIVQGPISRYQALAPRLANSDPMDFDNMKRGLLLVLVGVAKKMVIADRLALFVNQCFDPNTAFAGFTLYMGAICYSFQLYTDFSGCVDICRGVSYLFNVELINNFDRPYLATSIREFWTKWHISLSRWLRDYVYIPLGGNRKGTARKYVNLLITFLVSGLWHGAGLNFLVWGLLHAIYQIIGQGTVKARETVKRFAGIEKGSDSERIFRIVITFHLVTFAWIFFRAANVTEAVQYITRIFSEFHLSVGLSELMMNGRYAGVLLINLSVLFVFAIVRKDQEEAVDGIIRLHVLIRWVVYLLLFFDILLFGVYGSGYDLSGFLYGGF